MPLMGTNCLLIIGRSRQRTVAQWIDLCDSNSYVHGDIIHLQAWSHRAAHRNPNMANVPAVVTDDDTHKPILGLEGGFGFECRDCWGADPTHYDEVLVGADLTAIQLRAFAHYAGDKDYINLVVDPTVDMHNVHSGNGSFVEVRGSLPDYRVTPPPAGRRPMLPKFEGVQVISLVEYIKPDNGAFQKREGYTVGSKPTAVVVGHAKSDHQDDDDGEDDAFAGLERPTDLEPATKTTETRVKKRA